MTDSGQWKVLPDQPPAEEQDDRKKKKKVEEEDIPLAINDSMIDLVPKESRTKINPLMGNESEVPNESHPPKFTSYRASLMGFNGVAHSTTSMEEEDLFTYDKEISWKLPEEMKQLMKRYPVAPCTQDEYNKWCEPWNYALILTMLGKRFDLYVLKDILQRMWGFSSFELIDLPNNYFIVRFQDPELWKAHYCKVLYDGPWVIHQHCVLIQHWTPYFNLYKSGHLGAYP
ncbi:hypothetical protein QN277_022737 [Acacia crassicarpa]|uniref:DUF4283 domain-containing protein n=1 Tax=Acacia crassicarpa TaxID=499986 RepID=A0AAE1KC17_9FABA|nr:hypothetical protein QN277_022737 [Acacia crassicarpa]